ncbi:hypothetical protein ABTJ50_21200, partial [Acinetobacter baumannii]
DRRAQGGTCDAASIGILAWAITADYPPHMKNIEFLRFLNLKGPNIWTYRSALEVWIDIGELEDFPSNTIPGFVDRLTTWLPTLIEH